MKILINDYSGHPFPFELSQLLSRKHEIVHSYAQYFETPKANFKIKNISTKLRIKPIKISRKFVKDNFISRRSIDILYGKKSIELISEQKPNVVICCQLPLDPLYDVINYCKRNQIKTIFWMQDIYSEAISRVLNKKFPIFGKLIGKYYFYKEKKCEYMCDKIIIISSSFKKFIDKVNLKKTTIIENWSPVIRPNIKKIKYFKKKYNPQRKFCFIYSGTLGYKHNPELFIKIAENFPKVLLIIASKGKFANELKIISIKKLPNIKVIKWIDYENLSSFLSIADALIVTLGSDASIFSVPSKIYAYLTIGKPILGSMPIENLGAKKIKNLNAGYISRAGSIKPFIKNCKKIVENKRLRAKFSNNSKNYMKTRKHSLIKVIKTINQFC